MAKKILIVEDEPIMMNLLTKKLSSEGYDVSGAHDGEEGLTKIMEARPDLVLLDIIMPKIGGLELMERMQLDSGLKGIPIIIISNSGQPVEIDRAKELGAYDWLVKTEFDPEEVKEKVLKHIGGPNQ